MLLINPFTHTCQPVSRFPSLIDSYLMHFMSRLIDVIDPQKAAHAGFIIPLTQSTIRHSIYFVSTQEGTA